MSTLRSPYAQHITARRTTTRPPQHMLHVCNVAPTPIGWAAIGARALRATTTPTPGGGVVTPTPRSPYDHPITRAARGCARSARLTADRTRAHRVAWFAARKAAAATRLAVAFPTPTHIAAHRAAHLAAANLATSSYGRSAHMRIAAARITPTPTHPVGGGTTSPSQRAAAAARMAERLNPVGRMARPSGSARADAVQAARLAGLAREHERNAERAMASGNLQHANIEIKKAETAANKAEWLSFPKPAIRPSGVVAR